MTKFGTLISTTALGRRLGAVVSSLIQINSRVVYLGDSLIANSPMRSVRQLGQVFINSRLRPGVGFNQGIGGERQDQILARVNQTTAQAPSLVVFCGGTNDIAQNRTLAQMQADHQGIVDALIAAGVTKRVRWTIPRSTTITGPNETKRQDFNTWLRSRADINLVDLETVYDPATSDSYDGTHPSWIGTRKIAAAEAAVVGPLLAAGTTLYVDAADATAQGNLETDWNFSGTTGTVSGAPLPTGQVATGWTVTNNTSCAVACSKGTVDGFASQIIDITGSCTAQNTVRLTNTINFSPSLNPGEFLDCAIQLSITATDGVSAPTNLRGLLVQAGSIGSWGSNNPDASAGLVDIPISGVFRTEPVGLSVVAASISFEVAVQIPIGTTNIRIVASRLKAVKSETVAYAAPLTITSGKTLPAVSGTATVGSTLTANNQTWSGGAIVYTYQWQRGTTDIAGATSRTYVVQAADSGSTLRCVITGTNGFGASSYITANTTVVP
jgi:lysophospholipase L1-like esterase